MQTPSQKLAAKFAARLIDQGLMSYADSKRMEPKIAEGTAKGPEWKLPVEKQLEREQPKPTSEADHD